MIPEAAVEAAAKALDQMRCNPATLTDYLLSENVARAALEAASPIILDDAKADAYDEGYEVAADRYPAFNPYRKPAL